MSTLLRISVLSVLVTVSTSVITVNDDDPNIQYLGSWVKNPIPDPQHHNIGASLSFSNVSGAIAVLSFSGATQVAVTGAFPIPGVYDMASQYSIDDGEQVQYKPPSTIVEAGYRQTFFTSNPLQTGVHKLAIENLGQNFYLDAIYFTTASGGTFVPGPTHTDAPVVPPTLTTSAAEASHTPPSSTLVIISNTARSSSSITIIATSPSPQPSSGTATSSATASSVLPPQMTSATTSASSTAVTAPGGSATASSAPIAAVPQRGQPKAIPWAYIALAIVGFLLTLSIACWVAFCLWTRRRRRTSSQRDKITPHDPISDWAPPSPFYQRHFAEVETRPSTLTVRQSGAASSRKDELRPEDSTSVRAKQVLDLLSQAANLNLQGEKVAEHEDTSGRRYDHPLASPLSDAPLVESHHRVERDGQSSTITSSPPHAGATPADSYSYTAFPRRRRRSVDGGVRITVTGGPVWAPGGAEMLTEQDAEMSEVDVRSAASTLPPLYQPYPPS